jgi:hypothetical protein
VRFHETVASDEPIWPRRDRRGLCTRAACEASPEIWNGPTGAENHPRDYGLRRAPTQPAKSVHGSAGFDKLEFGLTCGQNVMDINYVSHRGISATIYVCDRDPIGIQSASSPLGLHQETKPQRLEDKQRQSHHREI